MNKRVTMYLTLALAIISTLLIPVINGADDSNLRKIGPYGGPSSKTFDCYPGLPQPPVISQVSIGHGDVIDSLQFQYGNYQTPKYGGNGGQITIVDIPDGDYITEISGYYGRYFQAIHIGQITIKTHQGNTYGPFGTNRYVMSRTPFSLKTATDTEQIVALFGGSYRHTDGTNFISSLGAYINTYVKPGPAK